MPTLRPRRILHRLLPVLLLACGDGTDPAGPGDVRPPAGDCSDGTRVTGSPGTLGAAGSPYRVSADLAVSDLVIEAGVTVCFDAGVRLTIGSTLDVRGTRDAPAVLTATEAGQPWRGIASEAYDARVVLTNATLSGAVDGVVLSPPGDPANTARPSLRLDRVTIRDIVDRGIVVSTSVGSELRDVEIRNVGGAAVVLAQAGANLLEGVAVDSACVDAVPGCAALRASGTSRFHGGGVLTLQQVSVAHSGGWGLSLGFNSTYTLVDVGLEASAHGIDIAALDATGRSGPPDLALHGSLRITEIEGIGVSGTATHVAQVRERAGGALDGDFRTIGPGDYPFEVPRGKTWLAVGGGWPSIVLAPGSRLVSERGHDGFHVGEMVAEGTAEEAVRLSGPIALVGEGSSSLIHAEVVEGRVAASSDHEVTVRDATLLTGVGEAYLSLGSGSTVARLDVDGRSLDGGFSPAIHIAGAGVTLADVRVFGWPSTAVEVLGQGTTIEDCRIGGTRSGPAILFRPLSGGGTVTGCSLAGNQGDAIENRSDAAVLAPRNWWGDPAGPGGPEADGVTGPVDASDPLPAAPTTAPAASIDLRGPTRIATGDAVEVRPVVKDVDGRLAPHTGLVWTLDDPAIARRQGSTWWIEGREVGTTNLTVSAEHSPGVIATTSIDVVPGGPALDWVDVPLPAAGSFAGLWAGSPDDILTAGGLTNAVYRWRGGRWTDLGAPFEEPIRDLVGGGGDTLWAVDRSGTLAHFDGEAWTALATEVGRARTLWRTDLGEIILCAEEIPFGVTLLHPGGVYSLGEAGWEVELDASCLDLWAGGGLVLAVVKQLGLTVARRDAGSWSRPYGNQHMRHIWSHRGVGIGTSSAEVFGFRAWRLTGDAWVGWNAAPEGSLNGLHGSDRLGLFSYGEELYHTHGDEWHRLRPAGRARWYDAFVSDGFVVALGSHGLRVGN